ncbi:hypothetical protein COCHEDRAFT_1019508, partial [Bipolaris maydis C5]
MLSLGINNRLVIYEQYLKRTTYKVSTYPSSARLPHTLYLTNPTSSNNDVTNPVKSSPKKGTRPTLSPTAKGKKI